MKKAGNAIFNLLYRIAGDKNTSFITLTLNWEKIVGKILANKSSVYRFEKGVLFVAVSNNVWMQELILNKNLIKDEIKKKLGIDVKQIVFTIKNNYDKNSTIYSVRRFYNNKRGN